MPLTTRFLFEVMLGAKIDPFIRSRVNLVELRNRIKFGPHSDQKPAPFENHKGCGTQIQNQKQVKVKNKSKSKSKTNKVES
jgi:hypothetical protein